MPLLDLDKLTAGLSQIWSTYLRDWDRSLRSANHPETTRYNYLLAAAQLARYLAEHSPDPDADAAAEDPTEVTRAHCESFQAWMIETRSAATALNKHKGLQQFFRWLRDDEGDIDHSPMERVRQPKVEVTEPSGPARSAAPLTPTAPEEWLLWRAGRCIGTRAISSRVSGRARVPELGGSRSAPTEAGT